MTAIQAIPPNLDLKQFDIFKPLSQADIILLSHAGSFVEIPKNEYIFNLGEQDNHDYFLVAGTIELIAADERSKEIKGGTPTAVAPLARLRPRQFSGKSKTPVKLIIFEHDKLARFLRLRQSRGDSQEQSLEQQIAQEILSGQTILQSLPKAIELIKQQNLKDPTIEALAQTIAFDLAICCKVMSTANTPLFSPYQPVCTLTEAIKTLGTDTCQQLMDYYCTYEVQTDNNSFVLKVMRNIWLQSAEVGSLCYLIAKETKRLNPEAGLLLGMLNFLGQLAILSYGVHHDYFEELANQFTPDETQQIAHFILEKWNFPVEFCAAVKHSCQWQYQSSNEQDYTSLLILANLIMRKRHQPQNQGLPDILSIPAASHFDHHYLRQVLNNRSHDGGPSITEYQKLLA
ncbi:HDOD domain-containing protein [Zooshikella marina]|uniref:HDOD domain-containing protein n=1 Tax=Zooshikella ganghwensis TaxID=202772 RepID=UPI001BAF7C45|nr:HDOD domain-containing protein [Zooshikella ganghwensis]MBU2705643.1 HDOD domain-containing protein [Zooshikella ganghwensis]